MGYLKSLLNILTDTIPTIIELTLTYVTDLLNVIKDTTQ